VITANALERTVRIQQGAKSGTGFTIDHDGQQYLVTARHVVDGPEHVGVLVRGNPFSVNLTCLAVPDADADVAVFRPDQPITPPDLPLPAGSDGLIFGQEVFFLGYPLGLSFAIGTDEYFPLVKRATASAFRNVGSRRVFLLDGWNNRGFSGGPVLFRPATQLGFAEPLRVAGINTGYYPDPSSDALRIGGVTVPDSEVLLNSGIMVVEDIARAVEAIGAAP
jgi:S1-C subfamily serine protease